MRALIPLLALSTLLGACAGPQTVSFPEREPLTDNELRRLPVYDGLTGARLTWDQAAQRAGGADAVLIGEMHSHPVGLPAAAVIFEDAINDHASYGVVSDSASQRVSKGALALEFFERDQQADIDAYLAGDIDQATFKHARGSSYPPGHERMLEFAKSVDMPVVAANAPRRFVRLARSEGYDHLRETLSAEELELLVIPEALDEGAYRDRFFGLMGGMSGHTADTESDEPDPVVLSFFRAQQVWDATMADAVANLVKFGRTPTFLVVGRFHTDHEGSTALRTKDALPMQSVITVTFANRDLGLLGLHPEDRGMADIVIYTGEDRR